MNQLSDVIEGKRKELAQLCERFRVQRFEVFGSAADGTFDPETSDLDFLVEFLPLREGEHFDAYFGLLEELQGLFERRIDLVETGAMRNPYFIRRVNESRTAIYAA